MARAVSSADDHKIEVWDRWCKGCGICADLCRRKVLSIDSRGKVMVTNPGACTGCGECEIHCPDFAITLRHDLPAGVPVYAGQTGNCHKRDITRIGQ